MTRIRLTAALLLALPAALAAQQPAAPTANPLLTSFKSFSRYGTWTVAAFDSIPESRYGFKPTPIQLSVGDVAQHLENANYLLCGAFGDARHPLTAKDSTADSLKARWPKDTLVARVRASFAFCDSAIARLDDSKLADPISFRPGAPPSPRMRFLLVYLTDVAEHYSQIAGYMRQMGMVPPSAQPRPRG